MSSPQPPESDPLLARARRGAPRFTLLALSCLLAAGCGEATGTDAGAATRDGGGGGTISRSCEGQPPAELGRCQVAGGGACMGADGEVPEFASLSGGGTVRMVIGPQGSTMLVFAIRAPGIDPGTGRTDWPLVELVLLDASDGEQLALYRSREEFTSGAGGTPEALELWVVVDGLAGELGGRSVIAVATVRDRTGLELCGSATVTVGS